MNLRTTPLRRILLPIRVRLAVGYSLLLAVLLVLMSALVNYFYTTNLNTSFDKSLQTQADTMMQRSVIGGAPGGGLAVQLPNSQMRDKDYFVQVVGLDGTILGKSDTLGTGEQLPLDAEVLSAALNGAGQYETVVVGNDTVRLYDTVWRYRGHPIGVIQVGRLISDIESSANNLRLWLALGSVGALLLALAVGWLVSGQALRPLGRLSRTAERIGQERDFSRRVQYMGPNDEVGRLAATFNTMLDRLQGAYADTQESARRLEAALTAQKRFVADASHELRTPLTAIRGNAELMERVPNMALDDRQASIAQIAREAQRMSRLVNDLLALARADAGQHLRQEPVVLAPLIHEAASAARHLPGGERLTVFEPLPEATVLGDTDSLRQLLLILMDNALKYTPPNGRVDLTTTVNDGRIEIAVADTGVGIAPQDLPHVFERFYRADPARSAGGTGLGLAIAGWIVSEHGGQIRVQSAPGAGATFTVVLPLAHVQLEREAAEPVHAA